MLNMPFPFSGSMSQLAKWMRRTKMREHNLMLQKHKRRRKARLARKLRRANRG